MRHRFRVHLPLRLLGAGAAAFALAGWGLPAARASGTPALLATAIHNTNTVRTLVHRDRLTSVAPGLHVSVDATGYEDEVHNREHDFESALVTVAGKKGAVKKTRYTLELVFINGLTYYKSSQTGNKWQTTKTTQKKPFPDPFLGGWARTRTTVKIPSSLKFDQVGSSGGLTHFQTIFTKSATQVTLDLYVSGGKTPYVAREDEAIVATKPQKVTTTIRLDYGPFNKPMSIQEPNRSTT